MTVDHAEFDVVVVGAGLAGLSAAKTYLQCSPASTLAIYDNHSSIGGVWCAERLYPDLKTNNQYGSFELPDFPMHEGYGVKPREHIPAAVVNRYVCDYADHFGLTRLVHLDTSVVSADKIGGPQAINQGWRVQIKHKDSISTVVCQKLIVSTGFTSQMTPRAHIKGEEEFGLPIMTSASIAQEAVNNLHNGSKGDRQITVMGASKSSYDFVWMYVSRGYKVNWVIRKSGSGAATLLPPRIPVGPFRLRIEDLITTRAVCWLGPSLWSPTRFFSFSRLVQGFLHRTSIGRFITRHIWKDMRNTALRETLGITEKTPDNHQNGLHHLIPDEQLVWYGTRTGVLNYPRNPNGRAAIHDYIRSGHITVYREDVSHLSPGVVHLADEAGTALPSPSGLAVATRWATAPNLTFNQPELHADLGIPSSEFTQAQKSFWHRLDERATDEVYEHLPWLKDAPPPPGQPRGQLHGLQQPVDRAEPFRLYRFLAPPGLTARGDHSIVFHGFVSNVANMIKFEISALWSYAYLNGQVSLPGSDASLESQVDELAAAQPGHGGDLEDLSFDSVKTNGKWTGVATTRVPDRPGVDVHLQNSPICRSAALWNAFARRRVPYGYGAKLADFEFEQLQFFDALLTDLRLRSRRKWPVLDWVLPYRPADYRGLVDEWLRSQQDRPRRGLLSWLW